MSARKLKLPWTRVVAVGIAAVLGISVAGGVTLDAMQDEDPQVYVLFHDASPLIKGNDVKAAGVKVGTIGSIEVEDGMAKVGLVLDEEVLPLHEDATARVRPVGLLGERYVELDRGSPDAPVLAEGAVLPTRQTSRATDLDEVLNMVDGPTGTALSMLLTTLGEGVMGRGEKADQAIQALAPAMQQTDRLAQVLDEQNQVLSDLLSSIEPVAQQLATGDGERLDALVDATDDTLAATARNDAALASTLEQLPSALSDIRATLASLTGAAASTAPVLAALRPTTDDLAQLSQELATFSRTAQPALDGLDPLLARARVLLAEARPVARSLASSAPKMQSTADKGREIGTRLLDNLTTIFDFVRYWALTTNGQDGLSHYFRAHVVVTSDILSGYVPGGEETVPDIPTLPGPGGGGGLLDGLDDVLPPLGNGSLDDSLGGLLNGLLGGSGRASHGSRAADGGSATGLTSSQEESLLSYLIGGE